MTRSSPMNAVLLAGVVAVVAWSCGPSLSQRRRQVQAASLAHADTSARQALTASVAFIRCMEGYGMARARANATPTEIADAATAECARPLNDYSFFRRHFHESVARAGFSGPLEAYEGVMAEAAHRAEADAAALALRGKQAAIKAVIESR